MPYGFGGGFAAGLDSGMGHGRELGELKLKREALMKEQINEKIKLTQGYIDAGLKNLSDVVTNAPQRDPKLEQTVAAYKGQLEETAQLLAGLGPEGEEASKFALSAINNIVPSLKTKAEAFSAEKLGEWEGAKSATSQVMGGGMGAGMTAPPAATAAPGAAGLQTTAQAPGAPAAAPAAGGPIPGATANGMSEEEVFKMFLGVPSTKSGPTTAQKNLMGQTLGSAHALFSGLDQYESFLKENGRSAGIPGTQAQKQATQMRRGLQLQLKELMNLGVLNGPDLDLMNELIFDPSSSALLMDFEDRAKNANKTVKDIIYNRVKGVEAGMTGQQLKHGEEDEETLNEDGDTPEQATPMPGSTVNAAGVPQPGLIEDGYRFKGGDPANPANWERVQ